MKHIMIDLETLGTSPFAVIVSIGAMAFNPGGGIDVEGAFYRNVDRETCAKIGLCTDKATIEWWAKQGADAQAALLDPDPQPVRKVMKDFTDWWWKAGGVYPWSHGATFDIPILSSIYRLLGQEEPWKFWNARCTRTLFDIAYKGKKPPVPEIEGDVKHNAAKDAERQAIQVIEVYAKLKEEE